MVKRLYSLIVFTFFSGLILVYSTVYADNTDVVDQINVTVPISCTMSGTGMTSHTAEILNGTYEDDIGTTTMKAFCNDNEGFAIYAVGYTDNVDGKNVLASSTVGSTYDIVTGTAISGNNSNWAMKLATVTDPMPTYPITIQNSFDSYHVVPDDYMLVAKRSASTDIGVNAEGSILQSTYRAYISSTQLADTYTGQVKYVLVHPNDTDQPVKSDQIAVVYNGNGLTFAGGATKNRVVYGDACTPMYIATTPEVVETSNLTNGVQEGGAAYTDNEYILTTKTYTGAAKVKVEVDYGITGNTAYMIIAEGTWAGWNVSDPEGYHEDFYSSENIAGQGTFVFEGDTITIDSQSLGTPESGYDYGFYVKIYPIYTTEQSGTEETTVCGISSTPVSGAYATTTTWNGYWYMTVNGETITFNDEAAVLSYLNYNKTNLFGTTVNLYSFKPYTIYYNGNGATAGTMDGFTSELENNYSPTTLLAPNFEKTGYGFAGWSEDPNATVNGNSKIFGPNEEAGVNDGYEAYYKTITFDNNKDATLYAVWVPSAGNLQNWSGCSSMTNGQVTALTDTRDNNVYAVGKLADGNCWMMENLRLDADYSNDSTKAQGFGDAFVGLADSEDTNFGNSTANSLYDISMFTGTLRQHQFPRYNNNNTNIGGTNAAGTTLIVTPEELDDQGSEILNDHVQWYSYGNYYTWAAAMANTKQLTGAISESEDTSICPTGWKLPYGRGTDNGATSGGFFYLNSQLGSSSSVNDMTKYPNNFLRTSGYYNDNAVLQRGAAGFYWTSTAYSVTSAYYAELSGYSFYPGNSAFSGGKSHGFSVRCLTQ